MAQTDERPGGVKELGHVVLYVRDLERSVRFYRDVLGWRQVGPGEMPSPAAMFSSGRTHHELLRKAARRVGVGTRVVARDQLDLHAGR